MSSPKKNKKADSSQKEKGPTPAAFTKKFKLSKDLSAIIGMKKASRSEIVKELWTYLKNNNLKDSEARQWFTPDNKMAKVFGVEKMKGFAMTKLINSHLSEELLDVLMNNVSLINYQIFCNIYKSEIHYISIKLNPSFRIFIII